MLITRQQPSAEDERLESVVMRFNVQGSDSVRVALRRVKTLTMPTAMHQAEIDLHYVCPTASVRGLLSPSREAEYSSTLLHIMRVLVGLMSRGTSRHVCSSNSLACDP